MASRVEFDPAPAMTGTRPRAVSTHSATTRMCCLWLRVGESSVVPTGTSPLVPSAICHSTSRLKAGSSNSPFLNGVMRAVMEPLRPAGDIYLSWTNSKIARALYDKVVLVAACCGTNVDRIHFHGNSVALDEHRC